MRGYLLRQVWCKDVTGVSSRPGGVVELGHELAAGGAGGGEVLVAFLELHAQVDDLLLQVRDLLVEAVDVGCGVEGGDDALAAARGVGLAAFEHRSGLGGVHAVASWVMVVVMGAGRAGRMAGMPRGTACAAR